MRETTADGETSSSHGENVGDLGDYSPAQQHVFGLSRLWPVERDNITERKCDVTRMGRLAYRFVIEPWPVTCSDARMFFVLHLLYFLFRIILGLESNISLLLSFVHGNCIILASTFHCL